MRQRLGPLQGQAPGIQQRPALAEAVEIGQRRENRQIQRFGRGEEGSPQTQEMGEMNDVGADGAEGLAQLRHQARVVERVPHASHSRPQDAPDFDAAEPFRLR